MSDNDWAKEVVRALLGLKNPMEHIKGGSMGEEEYNSLNNQAYLMNLVDGAASRERFAWMEERGVLLELLDKEKRLEELQEKLQEQRDKYADLRQDLRKKGIPLKRSKDLKQIYFRGKSLKKRIDDLKEDMDKLPSEEESFPEGEYKRENPVLHMLRSWYREPHRADYDWLVKVLEDTEAQFRNKKINLQEYLRVSVGCLCVLSKGTKMSGWTEEMKSFMSRLRKLEETRGMFDEALPIDEMAERSWASEDDLLEIIDLRRDAERIAGKQNMTFDEVMHMLIHQEEYASIQDIFSSLEE